MNELMTLEELSDYLRVTKKTIYRMLDRHTIPATKVGRQYRFDKAAIDSWLHPTPSNTIAKVLVIDDDQSICDLFKDTLEEAGHSATTVTDPILGLKSVQDEEFDLVFLDLMMPDMDGAELFGRIKAIKPDLPVTIITGYTDSDLMRSAASHGPFGVMGKPFRPVDILTVVNSYVRFSRYNQ